MAQVASESADTAGLAWEWLGHVSIAGARFEEAVGRYERAHEHGRAVVGMAEPWARALIKLGRRREACPILGAAAAAAPLDRDLQHRAGACYLRLGLWSRARSHLEAAHRQGLRHVAAKLDLAHARLNTGREDLAVDLLSSVTEASSDPATLLAVGKLLFRKALYASALKPLAKAWGLRPGSYEVGMYLALAHYQLRDYPACASVLSGLDHPDRPAEYRYLLGSVQARLGQGEAARSELETGIRLAPERADGYLNLGLFHLDHGRVEEALDLFDQASSKETRGAKIFYAVASRANCRGLAPPVFKPGPQPPEATTYVQLADTLLRGQQWGAALAVYLAAQSVDPRAPRPYGGIGLICQELGTAEVGLEFVMQGLRLHPGDSELHYYAGSLHDYLARPARAVESYQKALALGDPEAMPVRYRLRLGLAHQALGDNAAAEAAYRAVLARDPNSAEGHFRLGRLRFASGDYAEAERLLERAVRLDPFLSEAYYAWGLACVRNGSIDKGRGILESHRAKAALRHVQAEGRGSPRQ